MSEGEARKVIIARALVADPVLMILDEVCSGLDPVARKDTLLMIEKVGRSMTRLVLVTHHLEDLVPSITHVLLMDGGMIVAQGEKAAMAQRPQAGGTARPVRTRRSRGGRGPMTRPV